MAPRSYLMLSFANAFSSGAGCVSHSAPITPRLQDLSPSRREWDDPEGRFCAVFDAFDFPRASGNHGFRLQHGCAAKSAQRAARSSKPAGAATRI